jgi:TonB family protein
MMEPALLTNILAYSAQVACVAAVGTLMAVLVRVDAPAVRYAYWRGLVALCLVLPWVQGRALSSVAARVTTAVPAGSEAMTGVSASVDAAQASGWPTAIGLILLAGIAVRVIWMAASLAHLRRLRTTGDPAVLSDDHTELQHLIGASAEIRYVDALRQPVTFGAVRPIVLLPTALKTHPPEIQRAVLAHELLHVQRRDWVWLLAEEMIRAALWFHPAVWWLVSRVQLAREEVVDELAVLATGRRRTYIEALMAFADDTPLAPAAAFARRRHLFRRMVLLSKEAVMSSRRIVVSCAVLALTVMGGSYYAVSAFPMTQAAADGSAQAGALEKQAKPVTPENPIPARLHAPAATYPGDAAGARGSLTLRVTLDALGQVAETRPVGFTVNMDGSSVGYSNATTFDVQAYFNQSVKAAAGDTQPKIAAVRAFIRAATEAVRQWRYAAPTDAPLAFDVRMTFSPDAPSIASQSVPLATGITGAVGGGGRGGIVGGVRGGVAGGVAGTASASGSAQPVVGPDGRQAPLRVGGNIAAPTKIRHVSPVYPEEARAARVQGVVIIEATVDADGTVTDARVLRSIPLLDEAAVDAVKQWAFTPTLLNGQAVPVILTVTVNFTMQY